MNYEDRVVAFIDILGFKSIIDNTINKSGDDITGEIDKVVKSYNSIIDIWEVNDKPRAYSNIKTTKMVTIFSDTIVISFKAKEPDEVFYT